MSTLPGSKAAVKKQGRKSGKKRKYGRNREKCARYRAKHGGSGTKAGKNKAR